ncbi:MAG: CPBP family intramembrane metalloprotease [Sphingomonadales bacterium]|nr:CPBP family intramembrane metalloprotease [Sphingomonadales bacterium]
MVTATSDKAAPSPLLGWLAVVAGTGLSIGWVIVGQRIGAAITIEAIGQAMSVYYAVLFLPLIGMALLFGWFGKLRVLRWGDAPARWLAVGLALGAGGFLVTLGYAWLNGGLVPGEVARGSFGLIALGAALTLLQVGTEEVLFRGWLQPALIARVGVPAAVVLGAVVFAVFHIPAGAVSPMSLVNLVLGGVFFGLLALRSGGLVAPLAAHYAWNAIEDLGFGLVPNPGNGPLGSLSDWDLLGPPLWGGTPDGLNDSIGTTVALVALIVPLLLSRRSAVAAAPAAVSTA